MTLNNESQNFKRSNFIPEAIDNLEDLDISETLVEDIMLRRLYTVGTSNIKYLSESLKLSFSVISKVFERLRKQQNAL